MFFSLITSTILVPNSSAQEDTQVPSWIKNVAGWWANGEISENQFLDAIGYLINNNIISIPFMPCSEKTESQTTSSDKNVPDWVKNNAKWWAEDLIEDTDFINGIEYLIRYQIISIDNKKVVGAVPLEDIIFSDSWIVEENNMIFVSSLFFEIYGISGDCSISAAGNLIWNSLALGLTPNKMDIYNDVAVWNDPQKTVVVYPYFTYSAYYEPGFYTYYRGECDDCTTTKLVQPAIQYTSSGIGHQALTLLGYATITDIEIDRNPSILQQFDKVIMLHNEYVTRAMFDAITNHPNVIYLYPNALYAEIEVDYIAETITLIRGHNYPEPEIQNGFDWEFENTHPYEYDVECLEMEVYKIKNGWMTNCYPENFFMGNDPVQLVNLLYLIKDL
ncbi:hypothetical protein HX865_02055 [Marine Group I thaumarchaeote]|uniref:Peptidase n=1 Tax=Marine Group I thaumarchaeote TaxID=2511932 RepID=A0A7K4N1P1_9ARCH|nr:hypothetical protein [Marine Group I thaumarchaeote]